MPEENKDQNQPEIHVDRKSKILFVIIGLLIAGSVAVTFWRYMVKRDYIVQAQIDCDPETENCFIWECDPVSDVEGEACTGDPEEDIWYYKNVYRNAKNIPDCDPNDEDCTALVCDPGEKDCSEELCTPENVPEGETCNDPEQYLLENPPEEECAENDEECLAEEEATECEEGDEECLSEEAAEEECASDDQECLDAQSEEGMDEACTPDDPDCTQTDENGEPADTTSRLDSDNSELQPEPT